MVCGAKACEYTIKETPFTYKGETTFIRQPGEWCDACGEGVLTDKDTHATTKEMQTHKAKVDRLLTLSKLKN